MGTVVGTVGYGAACVAVKPNAPPSVPRDSVPSHSTWEEPGPFETLTGLVPFNLDLLRSLLVFCLLFCFFLVREGLNL